MKALTLFFFFFACSNIATDQRAYHFTNKGITCDAVMDSKYNKIICGETAVYTSDKSATGNKDAFFVMSSADGKTNLGYSFGATDVSERFEKIIQIGNEILFGGFYSDSKNKFLLKTNSKGEYIWGVQSDKFKTFEPGDMGMDIAGNVLLMTKDPSAEAYHGTVHLFDKDGSWKWSRDMSSIEEMQDIVYTKDGYFLISFKQKGAYIDGQTRTKYIMNSFYKVNPNGEIVWARKFHLNDDLAHDCYFSKILEDKNGNLYFMGKIELAKNRKQHLFLVKTDKEGRIFWSNAYTAPTELNFKNGCFDATGNLVLVADGYAKAGGISFMQVAPDGKILWSRMIKSASYEQATNIFAIKNGYEIIWDKLSNFASFTIDQKGRTCSAPVEELTVSIEKFPLLLDEFKGSWTDVQADWKKMQFNIVEHKDIVPTSDCK